LVSSDLQLSKTDLWGKGGIYYKFKIKKYKYILTTVAGYNFNKLSLKK